MINIPIAFYNKTPEEMVDIWQQVSQHLDKSFTPIKSVRFLKKHFPKYHLYYTKDLFKKHSLNIPDIQLFNIAKQIQQHFGFKSLTINIQMNDNSETLLLKLKNIFLMFNTFVSSGNYEPQSVGLFYKVHFFDYVNFTNSKKYSQDIYKGICFFKPGIKGNDIISIGLNMDSDTYSLVRYFSHEQAHAIDYLLGYNNKPYSSLSYQKKIEQPDLFYIYQNILSLGYNQTLKITDTENKLIQRKVNTIDYVFPQYKNKFNIKQKLDFFHRTEKKILAFKKNIPQFYEPFIITMLAKDDEFETFYPEFLPFLRNKDNPQALHKFFFKSEFLKYSMEISEKFANTRYNKSDDLILHMFYKELINIIKKKISAV